MGKESGAYSKESLQKLIAEVQSRSAKPKRGYVAMPKNTNHRQQRKMAQLKAHTVYRMEDGTIYRYGDLRKQGIDDILTKVASTIT